MAVGVPYLRLYDDGYYRPRGPTGRGQCHTDSGFGRAVWRCPFDIPISFRNGAARFVTLPWSDRQRTMSGPYRCRETTAVNSQFVQRKGWRECRGFDDAGNEATVSCTVATLPNGQTLSGNPMNSGVVAVPPPWHRFRICALRPSSDGTGSEDMEKLLLRPSEAAAHLSIGHSKVYELMRLGQLRSVKIGASRRIPQVVLADFIAAITEEPQ